ncbi:EspF repeat-containing protein [Streptomyces sp. NBC_00190]
MISLRRPTAFSRQSAPTPPVQVSAGRTRPPAAHRTMWHFTEHSISVPG